MYNSLRFISEYSQHLETPSVQHYISQSKRHQASRVTRKMTHKQQETIAVHFRDCQRVDYRFTLYIYSSANLSEWGPRCPHT